MSDPLYLRKRFRSLLVHRDANQLDVRTKGFSFGLHDDKNPFISLPSDMAREILNWLSPSDLCVFSVVSVYCHSLVKCWDVWANRITTDFSQVECTVDENCVESYNWKLLYFFCKEKALAKKRLNISLLKQSSQGDPQFEKELLRLYKELYQQKLPVIETTFRLYQYNDLSFHRVPSMNWPLHGNFLRKFQDAFVGPCNGDMHCMGCVECKFIDAVIAACDLKIASYSIGGQLVGDLCAEIQSHAMQKKIDNVVKLISKLRFEINKLMNLYETYLRLPPSSPIGLGKEILDIPLVPPVN